MKSFILFLIVIFPLSSLAQLTGEKFRKGYIIDKSGEKYEGFIRVEPGNERTAAKIEFKEDKKSKKETYDPSYIKSFKIESDSFTVLKKIPMPKKKVREADFAKVLLTGAAGAVYLLEYTTEKSSGHASTEYTITEENSKYYILLNGKMAMLTPSNFKDVALIVADCSDLKTKIASKKLKIADIDKAVSEYQTCKAAAK
jgi:hypothetical protein